jgi:hypothetical protein
MHFFLLYRIHSIIICVESCLFGLFVVTIFVDQVHSIVNDRSLIDTLKLDENSRMSPQILPPAKLLFRKVFGPGKTQTLKRIYLIFLFYSQVQCFYGYYHAI